MFDGLFDFIYKLCYAIDAALCWLMQKVYEMFEVFGGLTHVKYDGSKKYLINVFFDNSKISNIYWGMALIGMALTFAFAIISVIKKSFDLDEKVKQTFGQIIRGALKSIIIIVSMSAIVTAVLNSTNILMEQIDTIFTYSDSLSKSSEKTFTNKQYATMARIYNQIGNYAINPSYNSRYNLNSCFNAIRPELESLRKEGVFNINYLSKEEDTWQSVLQEIVNSADLSTELSVDLYYPSVSNSLLKAMDLLRTNKNFFPVDYFKDETSIVSRQETRMDAIIMMSGLMDAAKNDAFNKNASISDSLRGPYLTGAKDMYDYDVVKNDFDLSFSGINHILIIIAVMFLGKEFFVLILNCIARIFNMLLLYIIAPLLVSVTPLDDGAKMKQWSISFVVQSLSVFGSVIAVRLLIVFMPIILSSNLVIFDAVIPDLLAKIILVIGVAMTARKASGMISGILADNAGMQSVFAGDMGDMARNAFSSYFTPKGMLSHAASAVGDVVGAGKAVGAVGKGLYKTGKGIAKAGYYTGKAGFYAGKYAAKGAYYAGKAVGGLGMGAYRGIKSLASSNKNNNTSQIPASYGGTFHKNDINNPYNSEPSQMIELADMSNMQDADNGQDKADFGGNDAGNVINNNEMRPVPPNTSAKMANPVNNIDNSNMHN